jgi:hypothetical protein
VEKCDSRRKTCEIRKNEIVLGITQYTLRKFAKVWQAIHILGCGNSKNHGMKFKIFIFMQNQGMKGIWFY